MLVLPAQLTHESVVDTLRLFEQTIQMAEDAQSKADTVAKVTPLVIDGAALAHFDSSAVALLLACRRIAQKQGRRLAFQAMPEKLVALERLYGVADLLTQA